LRRQRKAISKATFSLKNVSYKLCKSWAKLRNFPLLNEF